MYFFILLLLDRNGFFHPVVMQTHTLNRYIILTGRDLRNIDAILIVSGKNLVNDTCAGMVELVKNNQYRIRVILDLDVAELEANSACIDNLC